MAVRIPHNPWSDRDVEAHWDRVAPVYIRENDRVKETHDQRFRESVRWLAPEDSQKILNISSRDGEAEDYIRQVCPSCEVTHAEISAGLMEVADSVRPGIRQVKLDGYSSLPFGDHAFDRVLSLETLEHVAEPLSFLSELYRVSGPDARLVLSCPPATSEFPYRVYSVLFGGHGEGPHRFPPSRRVKKMFEMTGWKVLAHRGTLLVPVGPAGLQRLGERIIRRLQNTWISELGIRQFFLCEKQ